MWPQDFKDYIFGFFSIYELKDKKAILVGEINLDDSLLSNRKCC